MKLRTRTVWINVVTFFVALGASLYFIYPHIYIAEGVDGVKFLIVTLLLIGAGTSLARLSLLEFFVIGKADVSVSETNRLKASVGSLSLGFVLFDAHNRVIMMNERAKHILAAGSHKDLERKWTLADITDRLSENFDLADKLQKSLHDHRLAEYADVAYREHILRVLVSPILSQGHDSGCVVLLEDVTEQRVMERTRDEFFSIASHELRTPLTAIRGNTALLQQFYGDTMKDKTFTEMINDIHTSSIRLIGIVNDFLDASRLEQGKIKMKPEAFDLSDVLETIAYETSAMAREKDNNIVIGKTLKALPRIYADKDRTKQVIYNLVGNAMKFTEHGKITIDARPEDNLLKVLVSDTGPGISEPEQKLLFHKFQQVSSSNNTFTRDTSRGSGLGLYISKLLVERMGGRIALDHSELGKGTTFSFTVPLERSKA